MIMTMIFLIDMEVLKWLKLKIQATKIMIIKLIIKIIKNKQKPSNRTQK